MQIVINVPEKLVCEGFERHFTEEEKNILIRAIGNGTPLPKRHGALIDREELRNKYASWYNLAIDKSINAILTLELYQIDPIIPADSRLEITQNKNSIKLNPLYRQEEV